MVLRCICGVPGSRVKVWSSGIESEASGFMDFIAFDLWNYDNSCRQLQELRGLLLKTVSKPKGFGFRSEGSGFVLRTLRTSIDPKRMFYSPLMNPVPLDFPFIFSN